MPIRYEKQDHIVTITIDRYERRNAIDGAHAAQLVERWEQFRDDPDAWVAIITGVQNAFCAGGDLKEMGEIAREVAETGTSPTRDRISNYGKGGFTLNFGSHGLKSIDPERITARQIEAARRAITRQMKRQGRVWIRIFPDVPVSDKPAEVRMGKGKGSPEFWVARVKPGRIMFELDGVPGPLAAEAFSRAAMKLPIKTKVVARLGDTTHLEGVE